jgi:hypothetical protein
MCVTYLPIFFSQVPLPAEALPAPVVLPAAVGNEEALVEEAEEVLPPDGGMEVLQQLMGRQLSIGQQFTHYDFSECYHRVTSVTEWFSDGFRRVINDVHVPSMFKDNFCVTTSKNGTFFHLQTQICPTLLNAADRAEQEFDPSNRDTSTIISSIRQTVNVIANALGTDFNNQWSKGNEYALPFACNPLPHVGIVAVRRRAISGIPCCPRVLLRTGNSAPADSYPPRDLHEPRNSAHERNEGR